MRVSLMLTCLCDAFYGEVGIACVRVLEAAGCTVDFDDSQTCCGQPPFNAGDWRAARKVAEHAIGVFGGSELGGVPPRFASSPTLPEREGGSYLVTPSASCAAMMRHGYGMLWPEREVPHCYEIGEFLVEVVGIDQLRLSPPPAPSPLAGTNHPEGGEGVPRRIALHNACHSRALHAPTPPHSQTLLSLVPGLELVDFGQQEQCCGFGGAFSATHGHTSSGIGLEKLRNFEAAGVEEIVSTDMGCLMHLNRLIERNGLKLRTRHYIELLAEALSEPPLTSGGEGAGGEGSVVEART